MPLLPAIAEEPAVLGFLPEQPVVLGDQALLHRRRPIPTTTIRPQILVIPIEPQQVCPIEFTWSELLAGDPLVRIPVWSNTPTLPSQLVFQDRAAFVACSTISIQEVVNQSLRRLLPTHTTDECGREAYAFVRVPDICGGIIIEPPPPPVPPPPICFVDAECPTGMVCVGGVCVAAPVPPGDGAPPPSGCPDWIPMVLGAGGLLTLALLGGQKEGRAP